MKILKCTTVAWIKVIAILTLVGILQMLNAVL